MTRLVGDPPAQSDAADRIARKALRLLGKRRLPVGAEGWKVVLPEGYELPEDDNFHVKINMRDGELTILP